MRRKQISPEAVERLLGKPVLPDHTTTTFFDHDYTFQNESNDFIYEQEEFQKLITDLIGEPEFLKLIVKRIEFKLGDGKLNPEQVKQINNAKSLLSIYRKVNEDLNANY